MVRNLSFKNVIYISMEYMCACGYFNLYELQGTSYLQAIHTFFSSHIWTWIKCSTKVTSSCNIVMLQVKAIIMYENEKW
jgi:hypothetical protein